MKKTFFSLTFLICLHAHCLWSFAAEPVRFKQQASHLIHATLDDQQHLLRGHITTTYVNNSPDTLRKIYIHLWPNAFSGNNTALAKELLEIGKTDFYFAPDHQRGFIDSLEFRISNKSVVWGYDPGHIDIAVLYPDDPVLPGQTISWDTPFRLKFPDSRFSRPGHNHQAYHATQWYPKPAVYDHNGWHPMPYLSFSEFYSEFGNIDLHLTLPANYVVASTGEVLTVQEREWLEELATKTSAAVHRGLPDRRSFPASSPELKTIHLSQQNVHDFAWVADKRFHVSRDSIILPASGSTVEVWAFFYSNAPQWLKATSYMQHALLYFSSQIGDYPWPSMSAAMVGNSGGANMEYPAFTVIGPVPSDFALESVLAHEIAHMWFYGSLASNERLFPWMDEGLTQYFEMKYIQSKYPNRQYLGGFSDTGLARYFNLDNYTFTDHYYNKYLSLARRNLDQPVEAPAPGYTMDNYFSMAYFKAALSLIYLEEFLGHEIFNRAIRQYYKTWSFHHPYPADLQHIFERVSGEDLSWFFNDLLKTSGKIDYRAVRLSQGTGKETNTLKLTIVNKGNMAVPFPVSGVRNDSVINTIWYSGFEGKKEISFPGGDYDALKIDAGKVIPEIFRHRNTISTSGLFPRARPLDIQAIGSIDDPKKKQLFFAPVLGWNKSNGFMPGLALYNTVFPFRPLQWLVMPMYGTSDDGLAGIAWIDRYFFPTPEAIQSLKAGINIRRFAFTESPANWQFSRIQTSLEVQLAKPFARSPFERSISLRNVWIFRDHHSVVNNQVVTTGIDYYVNELAYSHFNNRVLNPWQATFTLQQGQNFARIMGETQLELHYPSTTKGVNIRFFAGTFITKPPANNPVDFRFRLSGIRGMQDFMFDHTFPGRSQAPGSLWGKQIVETEGGLKFPTPVGQTSDWLVSVNLKGDLPFIPAKLYFDAGTYSGASSLFQGSRSIPWVLGVQIIPLRNILEVNIPIKVSSDIEHAASHSLDGFRERVTFSLYFNNLDPFRILRNL